MLHLIYYLSCLANVEDVRTQNKQAFELHKLAGLPDEQTPSTLYIQEEEEELVDDSTDQSLVPTQSRQYSMIQEVSNEEEEDC
jgi:hypothetical protein